MLEGSVLGAGVRHLSFIWDGLFSIDNGIKGLFPDLSLNISPVSLPKPPSLGQNYHTFQEFTFCITTLFTHFTFQFSCPSIIWKVK